MRCKIDETTALSRRSTMRIVPDEAPTGWDHAEDDNGLTPRDGSRDYQSGVAVYPPSSSSLQTIPASTPSIAATVEGEIQPVDPAVATAGSSGMVDGFTVTETAAMRRFLLDAGVLSGNDGITTIAEIRGFVRGRMR